MLNIGICDDQVEARQFLSAAVERQLGMDEKDRAFFEFSSGEGLIKWLSKNIGKLDILFLDIEMGELNGMETAAKIRELKDDAIIVFVTSYKDYVFDGYKVGAIGYLTKPVDQEKLGETLGRALGMIEQKAPEVYLITNKEGLYRIPKKQIQYFCSDKRQVILVSEQQRYSFYAKLDEVAGELGDDFVRIHQRTLVRAGAVSFVQGNTVQMISGEQLQISRACRAGAILALSKAIMKERKQK